MVKKISFSLIVVFLISLNLKGQRDEEGRVVEFDNGSTLEVTGIKDDPENFYNIGLSYGLNFGSMPEKAIYGMLLNLKLEYTDWDIGSWYFRTDLQVARGFITKYNKIKELSNRQTKNPLKPYNVFETGFSFNLISDEKQKIKDLALKTEAIPYDRSRVYKAPFNVTIKKMLKARTGFHNYNNTVTNWNLKPTTLKAKNGDEIYELERDSYNSIDLDDINIYHTNMNVNSLFFGLSYHSIFDTKMNVEGYENGESKEVVNAQEIELYADFMYAPGISFENMKVGDNRYVVDHSNGGGFEAENTGLRIGIEYDRKMSDYSGFNCGFVVGQRPGWKNQENQAWITNSVYFMFILNGKLGLSKELF